MDSPGNDLESIAGQVAAGCNMIFFVTGNGSITNFPFVPTVKIVTTTDRYNLLADDMDINAGAYLDGTPLADLGKSTLNYTLEIAGGQLSVGEKAGHSQVQIWRDWQLSQPATLEPLQKASFSGKPLSIDTDINVPDVQIDMLRDGDIITSQRAGLILPTSLCSGQIARLCVNALNQHPMLAHSDMSHFVTLAHTEGCGSSINAEFDNTLLGYLKHPFVKHALLLEHGCEATHNDYFRNAMQARGYRPENYGWASIQQDGGIQAVIRKMVQFFDDQIASEDSSEPVKVGLSAVSIAITTQQTLSARMTEAYTRLTRMIVAAGGTVILHEQDNLLKSDFLQFGTPEPTLEYAGVVSAKGLHIMAMPTDNWSEILTGLGASGIQLILNHTSTPLHGHPMIPVLQVSDTAQTWTDIALDSGDVISLLLDSIVRTLSGRYVPRTVQTGNVNFQITRGLLGVSL
jgi:altronate dehydratase